MPARVPISVEQLFHTRAVSEGTWAPDSRSIAFISNLSGRRNIWLVDASGGWPRQLSFSDQRETNLAWSPDGRLLAFASDQLGDELHDLWVVALRNGERTNLTCAPGIDAYDLAWSPDSRLLAYARKPRDATSYEIYLLDVATREEHAITRNTAPDRSNYAPRFLPNGRGIVFRQARTGGGNSDLYLSDLDGELRLLTEHAGNASFVLGGSSPDSKLLSITTTLVNGQHEVALLDLRTAKLELITNANADHNARGFSADGKQLLWTRSHAHGREVVAYSRARRHARALPLPRGFNRIAETHKSCSRDGRRLLFLHEAAISPEALWTFDFKTKRCTQLTHGLPAGLQAKDLVTPKSTHYRSADGKWDITALLYVPHKLERNGRNPAVVLIHGGPAAQALDDFDRPIQLLVSHGYVVIVPNYRGSKGYGQAFEDANQMDMGGGDLQDVLSAAEQLERTGYVSPEKIAAMGTSYGGYLTLLALTKAPARFAAGVALVPFVNWFTEYEHEDPLMQRYDRAKMGDPTENQALWRDRSPIFFADQARAPALLVAGAHDRRCPPSEAQQMVDALRKNGARAELKLYADEGHALLRLENQIDAYARTLAFLSEHLSPA